MSSKVIDYFREGNFRMHEGYTKDSSRNIRRMDNSSHGRHEGNEKAMQGFD